MRYWLEIPGVSQVEKAEHSRSNGMYKDNDRFTGIVPLLLFCNAAVLCGCFLNSDEVWVGIVPLCSGWPAYIIRTNVHTEKYCS